MKLISIIFSIYMLGLNLLPCSDTDGFINNSDSISTIISSPSGDMDLNHSHGNSGDLCPPFCTCHCCHVHTVDFGSINFKAVAPGILPKDFIHFDSIGEQPISSLLDPPRI